jgi:hypothetical protein
MNGKEKVSQELDKIWDAFYEITKAIEETETEEEYYEILSILSKHEPLIDVSEIWDMWVDWDRVKWYKEKYK